MQKFIVVLLVGFTLLVPTVSWAAEKGSDRTNVYCGVADGKVLAADNLGGVEIINPDGAVPLRAPNTVFSEIAIQPVFVSMGKTVFVSGSVTSATIAIGFDYGTNSVFKIENCSDPIVADWRGFLSGEQVGVQFPSSGRIIWHVNPDLLGTGRYFRVMVPVSVPPS